MVYQADEYIHNSTELETVIVVNELERPFSLLHITDSHISCDGEADEPYIQYSARMNACCAPGTRRHFKTGELTSPMECFAGVLAMAGEKDVDMLVLGGDIINYPSPTAVAKITEMLNATGIPWAYTAGNHDWHYEGMPGSGDALRKEWIEKRLKPFYQGKNPFCSALSLYGLSIVLIDNSTYQVNEEQLDFYRAQAASGKPLVLFAHIPLYMPFMHICCGHPGWGAETDTSWGTERRERWPRTGNSPSTVKFVEKVMETPKLAGIFTGHWHNSRVITKGGKVQYVSAQTGDGRYRLIRFVNRGVDAKR